METRKQKCALFPWCRRNAFLILLLLSTISGYVIGLFLQPLNVSNHTLYLIGFPGQLVLRAFFMIIVPLIFCSLVLGVSSLRKGGDARMVALTIGFFITLSTFSAIMGALAGHFFHPGQKVTSSDVTAEAKWSGRKDVILDSVLNLLLNAVPSNVVEATFVKEYTDVEIQNISIPFKNYRNTSKRTLKQTRGVNFMGLLTFSILFGCSLATLGDKGEQLHKVIEQLNAVIMSIMGYCLNLLPLGMFFWMLREGIKSGAQGEILGHLGLFVVTSLGCIAFHQLVFLPLLYLVIVRKNPVRYHLNLLPAILTAFGTASSAATLPVTVRCSEVSNKVNRCVTRFVLPLGMAVHMNGGTFHMVLASIFLAQLEGIELGVPETTVMCLTAILLLISVPATASGGTPVYLLTVLASGGITRPLFISFVLSLDWILERFRTVMNVVGDCYVAAFVESLCRKRLPQEDPSIYRDSSPLSFLQGQHNQQAKQENLCQSCGDILEITGTQH